MRTLPAFLLTLALMFAGVAAVAAPAAIGRAAQTVSGTPVGTGWPACQEEDGSTPGQAFPCWWDAATQGNGLGVSYGLAEPMTCDYAQSFGPTAGCPPVDR